MDKVKDVVMWLVSNYAGVLVTMSITIGLVEVILSRLFPSKKRTSILMKLSKYIHLAMDYLKVPDVKRDEVTNKIMMYGHVNEKHEN